MVEHDIPAQAARAGEYLKGKLTALKEKHAFATDVRGMGLLLGFGMADDRSAAVVNECRVNGLLLNSVRPNVIRLMPPLTVSNDEMDQAVGILDAVLGKVPPAS